jgi:hypothetical protein
VTVTVAVRTVTVTVAVDIREMVIAAGLKAATIVIARTVGIAIARLQVAILVMVVRRTPVPTTEEVTSRGAIRSTLTSRALRRADLISEIRVA